MNIQLRNGKVWKGPKYSGFCLPGVVVTPSQHFIVFANSEAL